VSTSRQSYGAFICFPGLRGGSGGLGPHGGKESLPPASPPSFRRGKRPRGFFCIITGQIKLVKSSLEGKEYIIRLVGRERASPGGGFGEIPYPAHGHRLRGTATPYFSPRGRFCSIWPPPGRCAATMLATLEPPDVSPDQRQLEDISLKEVISPAGPVSSWRDASIRTAKSPAGCSSIYPPPKRSWPLTWVLSAKHCLELYPI